MEQYILSIHFNGTIIIIFPWKYHFILFFPLANLLLIKVCFGQWYVDCRLTSYIISSPECSLVKSMIQCCLPRITPTSKISAFTHHLGITVLIYNSLKRLICQNLAFLGSEWKSNIYIYFNRHYSWYTITTMWRKDSSKNFQNVS